MANFSFSQKIYLGLLLVLCTFLLIPVIPKSVSAASCTTSVLASSTIGINTPGSYTVWVRYQAQESTILNLNITDTCHTIALPKTTANEWSWTSMSTQGTNTVATFADKKSYTIDVSGNELIKLDSLFLLKLGEICSDTTATPKGNADNCKTAFVQEQVVSTTQLPTSDTQQQTPPTTTTNPDPTPTDHNEQHTPAVPATDNSNQPKPIPPIAGTEPVSGEQELPAVSENTAIPEEVRLTAIQVEYYVNTVLAVIAGPNDKAVLDTTKIDNGKNDVEIVVTDGYGNKTRYASTISVNNNETPAETVGRYFRTYKGQITLVTGIVGAVSILYLAYRGLVWFKKREKQLLQRGITRAYRSEFSTLPKVVYTPSMTGILLVGGLLILSTGTLFAAINSTPKTTHVMAEFENASLTSLGKSETGDKTAIGNSYVTFVRPQEIVAQTPQPTSPTTTTPVAPQPSTPVVKPPTQPAPSPTPTPIPQQTTGGINATSTVPGQVPKIASNFDLNRFLVSAIRPDSSASEPTGNFRFICEFSHFAYDDPIVYPNKPGVSHLHMFFGNTTTNASSTYESLRQNGDSTCQGGPINRSAYWVPAVYNSQSKLVIPDYITVYYKGTFGGIAGIQNIPSLPRGLRMIAGYNMANPNGSSTFDWYCEVTQRKQKTTQNCPNNERLGAVLPFQQCWNGQNLDSADHRSHMAYLYYDVGGARCPSSHPVHLAEFTIGVWYPNDGNTGGYYLSSDRMSNGVQMPNGSSWHADWYGAWDDSMVDRWTNNCIRGLLNCFGGNLGDGQALSGARNYTGPSFVDPPPKP